MHKKKTYVPMPEVPPEMQERYRVMLEVMSGVLTVKAAAKKLGMSRNHFQTLIHRGLGGLIQEMSPKKAGRPSTPVRELALMQENEQLRRQNERLMERVETIDRMLGIAGDLLRGQVQLRGRSSRTRPKAKKGPGGPAPEEPDGALEAWLDAAQQLRSLGLSAELAAAAVATSSATVRRWQARKKRGHLLSRRRGPPACRPIVDVHTTACVEDHVRELGGLVGAASLSKSFPEVSRRMCDAIKKETLRAMERERVARADRITITHPGVIRGFDQLHLATTRGPRVLLFSGDGAVQYRTSVTATEHYNGANVAYAVENDFRENGPPLVWRADRARSHQTEEVGEVLRHYGVLLLHGPPRHPQFYGQLERQNREHRAMLDALGLLDPDDILAVCDRIRHALNNLWKRPTLGWRTANDVWNERPTVQEDRNQLREEVQERAARIRRHLDTVSAPANMAERLAIQHALRTRGYLRQQVGGWC
jgi:transposase